MDIKKRKIHKNIVNIMFVFIIVLLFFLIFTGKIFAKYKKSVISDGLANVAKPVFEVDGVQDILIRGIDDTVYNFTIRNYNESDLNEVPMQYYIEFINNSSAELSYELLKNNEKVELNNNKTNLIFLNNLEKQEDNYILKIHNIDNPEILSSIEGKVQIKVQAMQVEI